MSTTRANSRCDTSRTRRGSTPRASSGSASRSWIDPFPPSDKALLPAAASRAPRGAESSADPGWSQVGHPCGLSASQQPPRTAGTHVRAARASAAPGTRDRRVTRAPSYTGRHPLRGGVIGSTPDSGSGSWGSSPCPAASGSTRGATLVLRWHHYGVILAPWTCCRTGESPPGARRGRGGGRRRGPCAGGAPDRPTGLRRPPDPSRGAVGRRGRHHARARPRSVELRLRCGDPDFVVFPRRRGAQSRPAGARPTRTARTPGSTCGCPSSSRPASRRRPRASDCRSTPGCCAPPPPSSPGRSDTGPPARRAVRPGLPRVGALMPTFDTPDPIPVLALELADGRVRAGERRPRPSRSFRATRPTPTTSAPPS